MGSQAEPGNQQTGSQGMSHVQLDTIDKRILVTLQGDLDDSPEPYARIAGEVGVSESEVILRIRRMMDEGVIRRLGAMIRHIEAGIGYNGMVIWKVDPQHLDETGKTLSKFPEVTHCYERPAFGERGGTLFTMVHASSQSDCMEIVRKMAEKIGGAEYEILFSERELKKISMTYFSEETEEE
jgi:DNA-binding Lrp family transcriptional regulator